MEQIFFSPKLLIVLMVLLIVSTFYNKLIDHLHQRGRMAGYTWLTVVVGVLYTLLGLAILDWQAAVLALLVFAFSGSPMALGDIRRFWQEQEGGTRRIKELVMMHNIEGALLSSSQGDDHDEGPGRTSGF
ncbi:MAG: hypothetical protein L0332_23485 [Chloroflexi bacterium]|nr:hypothetical protein [Chloroflexota bacterium]